ncbi:Retrotransposon gag protein [Rhizoctonia solani]|uniref:Retrotransposon gag protein n=1 Tax=Rhizoctonia solani TaxID=456999 RepID=A0A8H7IDR0_9AGAM|nr:Retrotransposon gag protein [Rhizoctonia solani]
MEPEPTTAALLEAITALTATVGSLQAQITSQGQQLIELKAICKETANLLGDKDQGAPQAQPGPLIGPVTPPTHLEEKPTLQEEPRQPKKEPQGTPARHLGSLTPFDAGSGVKRPKMDLPDPYKGDTRGRKATQWLDRMMLWVALHRDQQSRRLGPPHHWMIIKGKGNPPTTIQALTAKFKEAFANPDAKRAAARKIAALTQTTTTSEYVTKFRNLMAELNWNTKAYMPNSRAASTGRSRTPSTKDNIPDNDLEAIFAALVKIDNTCWENEENRPKKTLSKPPVTATTSTSTTTTRVRLSEDPNYVTPEEQDHRRASGLCVKCGQKGHGIKQCPNGWKATIKEVAKVAEEEGSGKD